MGVYELARYGSDGKTVHGNLLELLQDGEGWLKAQKQTAEWDRALEVLAPSDPAADLEGESNTGYNKTKRITREMVAAITNFRYDGEIRSDHDKSLYERAALLTKRDRAWFQQTFAHDDIKKIIQYAVGWGTGYGYQEWDKAYWGPNRGDVSLQAISPEDVYMVQLPKDNDLQKAYAVIIRFELPINMARRIYSYNPAFAKALTADRDAPGWLEKGLRKIQQLMGGSPVFRFAGRDKKNAGSFPTTDVFHAYVYDTSINETSHPVLMGDPGTNWQYRVPYIGQDIPVVPGSTIMKKAEPQDCLLFPLRRLCIFSRSVPFPCKDGSSPWWHGKVPLAQFSMFQWAWEALGQGLVGDLYKMQQGIEIIMRGMEDSANARLDPPLVFDDQFVSKEFAEAVNPRRGGVRVAASLNQGEFFKVLGEQWQYEVPSWTPDWIKAQEGRMDYLAALPDMVAIAKAKQVPGGDTLEKIFEMAGPMVQDIFRSTEKPFYQLGEMRKALYMQFDSRARLLQLLGEGGDIEEEVDYRPDKIVPLLGADESAESYRERRKAMMEQFNYHLTQSGVNEIHRMTTRLVYLQLQKAGFPISWWTLAKIFKISNFGKVPTNPETGQEAITEIEQWVAQQHLMRELAQELGGGPGQGPGPGRPQSGKKAPQIATKDQGTRSTVKTS